MSTTENSRQLYNYIDNRWTPAESGLCRRNVNPADTSDVLGNFTESGGTDVELAVDAAHRAQRDWSALGAVHRAEYLTAAAQLLTDRTEEFARAITREQGKLLSESRGEVRRSLSVLEFTAGEARRLNGETTPAEEPRTWAMTFRRPIGVVGLITPWNFPLAIPMWKVAPALLSGCTAVLKPSPLTPLTAAMLVDVFHQAGVPAGVVNLVQGDRAAGEALTQNSNVSGVSFTGSLPVGKTIQQAGATRLLRTQLELGGKNAVVVLDDADLSSATDAIIHGAFGQAGQRCSATSRVVADTRIHDELVDRITSKVANMPVGPGDDPSARIGPVVDETHFHACLSAVHMAQREGARVACGGRAAAGLSSGYFVEPTVLRNVDPDSHIAQTEIFGPVLSVLRSDGFDEAVEIANGVRYGMSATLFTQDPRRMFEALDRFEAGMLHVNRPGVGSYAHMPHGGTKDSQFGPPECGPHVWDFYTEWRSACLSY